MLEQGFAPGKVHVEMDSAMTHPVRITNTCFKPAHGDNEDPHADAAQSVDDESIAFIGTNEELVESTTRDDDQGIDLPDDVTRARMRMW